MMGSRGSPNPATTGNPRPPAAAAAATAAGGGGARTRDSSFWSHLKIEIDQPYDGHGPEWHPESSETTSIPAQISDSPSEADTGIITNMAGGEAFVLPARVSPRAEPRLARWVGHGLAGGLVVLGLAHLAVQLATFLTFRIASSWWAGALSLLIGALGLVPWTSCLQTYHRALVIMGILVFAVAAVLDMRTAAILREPALRCGNPTDPVVAMTIGEWCALDQRRGGPELYSCGCIIPGSEPGDTDSCLAFHQPDVSSSSASVCDAGAQHLAGLVTASAVLCWTLATICLVASLAHVLTTCYRHRRCPGPCVSLWSRPEPEQTEPAYLRNSIPAVQPSKEPSSSGPDEEQQEGPPRSKAKKAPGPYYLRDCPNGSSV